MSLPFFKESVRYLCPANASFLNQQSTEIEIKVYFHYLTIESKIREVYYFLIL